MPGVVHSFLIPLSGPRGAGSTRLDISSKDWDYAIGGIGFLSATDGNHPYQRGTAPYRKDQFDTSQDPGEQSLVSWWMRSQSSFHGGAGLEYEIPYSTYQPRREIQFERSAGVDVSTPGKVTLLPATAQGKSAGAAILLQTAVDANGADCYLQAEGASLAKVTDAGSTALTWGGAGSIQSIAFDGTHYFVVDNASIWKDTVPAAGAGAGAAVWTTGATAVVLGWAKNRLMAGVDNKIYELVGAGPALPATPTYTHPNTAWRWKAFAEGPSAIYVAGSAGSHSSILKLTLDTSGAAPTLTSATDAVPLPEGELVTSLLAYGGTFLIIGTNKGVRVGIIDTQSGDVTYGPLNVKTSSPVYGLTAFDRFVFAGVTDFIDGASGLCRVDLSLQNQDGFYPYTTDLQAHVTGTVDAVCQYGTSGRKVIGVASHGSYVEKGDGTLEASGYLVTERVRFHTLDPKLFKAINIRAAATAGEIAVSQIDVTGTEISLITFGANSLDPQEVGINSSPAEFMQFKFTLTPNVGLTAGPEFHGYQLKALPGTKRQRLFKVPLWCFDSEQDRHGNRIGYKGSGLARLQAIESLEETGDVVLFQDFARQETKQVVIDEMEFVEQAPPEKRLKGSGGLLIVTLRSVS